MLLLEEELLSTNLAECRNTEEISGVMRSETKVQITKLVFIFFLLFGA